MFTLEQVIGDGYWRQMHNQYVSGYIAQHAWGNDYAGRAARLAAESGGDYREVRQGYLDEDAQTAIEAEERSHRILQRIVDSMVADGWTLEQAVDWGRPA